MQQTKNENKSTHKDPKTEMVCSDVTKNEHVLDQKTHIKRWERMFILTFCFARCLLLLFQCSELSDSKKMLCAEISMIAWNGGIQN